MRLFLQGGNCELQGGNEKNGGNLRNVDKKAGGRIMYSLEARRAESES